MRLSMATAISVALAASLFAGCSTSSQGTSALPGSSSAGAPMGHGAGAPNWQIPHGKISPLQRLKMQIAGKLPGPATRGALKWQLGRLQGHARPHYRFHPNIAAKMWSDDTDFGYLLGLSKKFKTLSAINTEADGCYDPITVKIDHSHNIWTACEANSTFEAGAAQEYSSSGTALGTYNVGCPTNIPPSQCAYFFSETFDQFENSSYVFANLTYYENCYFVGSVRVLRLRRRLRILAERQPGVAADADRRHYGGTNTSTTSTMPTSTARVTSGLRTTAARAAIRTTAATAWARSRRRPRRRRPSQSRLREPSSSRAASTPATAAPASG